MPETGQGGPMSGNGGVFRRLRHLFRNKYIILATAVVLVSIAAVSWRITRRSLSFEEPMQAAPVTIKTESPSFVPENSNPAPESLPDSLAPYRSEHYRTGEIAVGGEMGLFVPESDPSPLSIDSVHGEAFSGKGKSGGELVVTWETNKPARSTLSYGKGVGQAEAVITEEAFGTNHSVVIPNVSSASTYVYVISAQDKWGMKAESDPYAVYTGAKEISLFELIAGAIGEVFGWTVDRSQ
ncbi:MAG: hypothetical protein HGB18_03805 [Candidatus Moranbacteria bacterium]|nr:hypothetical protein [Candidatus Moranbacteria bacterium]